MYQYKIILAKNNKQNKVIKKYTYFKPCWKKFEALKEQSNKVVIPRKFNTHNGLHKVRYDALLLKRKPKDKQHTYKDYNESGILESYTLNSNNWQILDKFKWNEEEKFYVYGEKKRLTCLEIYEKCLKPRMHYFTQVLKMFNKLVIDDGEDMEVVLCKTEQDCNILYHKLLTFADYQNLSSFLFLGHATYHTRMGLRDRLCEFTGLKRQEFYRRVSKSKG
jgi:hypothetical protein